MPAIEPTAIATFFIGGAADKNRFWAIGPKTNLIRDRLLVRYLDTIKSTPLGAKELNRDFNSAHWGYDEMDRLFQTIHALCKQKPGCKIRLIGHSLGGWQAAKMTSRLAQIGIPTSLLITIDPVGISYFMNFPGNETGLPRPVAAVWVNLLAEHTIEYALDDGVADAGVRWKPARDNGLKSPPTFDIGTPYSHADVWQMMVFPGQAGISAWQLLTRPVP